LHRAFATRGAATASARGLAYRVGAHFLSIASYGLGPDGVIELPGDILLSADIAE
jgi:hypothetical protein